MDDAISPARLERAAQGYLRFQTKKVVSALFYVVMIVVAVLVLMNAGVLWAFLVFVVGGAVGRALLGLFVMLPLGYAFCGRDAMNFGQELQQEQDRRRRGY